MSSGRIDELRFCTTTKRRDAGSFTTSMLLEKSVTACAQFCIYWGRCIYISHRSQVCVSRNPTPPLLAYIYTSAQKHTYRFSSFQPCESTWRENYLVFVLYKTFEKLPVKLAAYYCLLFRVLKQSSARRKLHCFVVLHSTCLERIDVYSPDPYNFISFVLDFTWRGKDDVCSLNRVIMIFIWFSGCSSMSIKFNELAKFFVCYNIYMCNIILCLLYTW